MEKTSFFSTKLVSAMTTDDINRARELILHDMRTKILSADNRGDAAMYYNLLGKELKRRGLGG